MRLAWFPVAALNRMSPHSAPARRKSPQSSADWRRPRESASVVPAVQTRVPGAVTVVVLAQPYRVPGLVVADWNPATHDHLQHYDDVIMASMASQITSLTIVYSTVYSDADQRKLQSSASLVFVWGIHRGPVNSPHKWPVTRKMFPFDDVIMWGEQQDISTKYDLLFDQGAYLQSHWFDLTVFILLSQCNEEPTSEKTKPLPTFLQHTPLEKGCGTNL